MGLYLASSLMMGFLQSRWLSCACSFPRYQLRSVGSGGVLDGGPAALVYSVQHLDTPSFAADLSGWHYRYGYTIFPCSWFVAPNQRHTCRYCQYARTRGGWHHCILLARPAP